MKKRVTSPESRPGEGGQPKPQITVIELAEDPGPGSQNQLASAVANAVGHALDAIDRKRADQGEHPLAGGKLKQPLMSAASTAVGAIEGTLKGKSLEGALKEAQIVQAFAEARERNASAARQEAEAEKIRAELAWAHLQNTLKLFQDLGVKVRLTRLPDGRFAIMIGDQTAATVPSIQVPEVDDRPILPAPESP